jgi:hypothetical protein
MVGNLTTNLSQPTVWTVLHPVIREWGDSVASEEATVYEALHPIEHRRW